MVEGMTSKKIVERVKKTIRRKIKVFETEKGISLSLKLKKERWDFISELLNELNNSTIYLNRGYTITSRVLLPTPSQKVLNLTFHISSNGYSVPYPVFDRYWAEYIKIKEPVLLITPAFALNSIKDRYYKFLRERGLVKENKYPTELKFKLDKSEYELVEYLI